MAKWRDVKQNRVQQEKNVEKKKVKSQKVI